MNYFCVYSFKTLNHTNHCQSHTCTARALQVKAHTERVVVVVVVVVFVVVNLV